MDMKNIIFFDTETNGKPIDHRAAITNTDNWPRITQLAFQVCNRQGEVIKSFQSLIKPDGWVIPMEKFFIDNGHSTERCESEGIPINEALDEFIEAINGAEMIVAHNMAFDYPVVICEMIRYKRKAEGKPKQFCTMRESTDICRLEGKYGYKWPSLQELHVFCFGSEFDGAHDAMADVTVCRKSFFDLASKGLISPFD